MFPNELRGGAEENDPVPTGVTVDDEGNVYVSFLPGFPPVPGSAKVVQVSPEGEVTDYATDLNILTDLQAAPDGSRGWIASQGITEPTEQRCDLESDKHRIG